jgi:formamidopyrimidine-DNA glycosylase
MPEMPEVQAHAERLADEFAGSVLASFRPLHLAALKTYDPGPDAALGRELSGVGRRGKYLYLRFDEGEDRLTHVVHLMQGGRLRPDAKKSARPKNGMARWEFSDGRALLLTEAGTEKRAGIWVVAGDPDIQEPVDHLGPEAAAITEAELADRLASSSGRIHGFLRDQREIAGIGRMLANEILHSARLSPFANTSKLDAAQVARLHSAMREAIERGLVHDRGLDDMGKSADRPSSVHHRVGEECPVCGDPIRSVEYRKYFVAYCPTCQTDGKILADNTTSRFLK